MATLNDRIQLAERIFQQPQPQATTTVIYGTATADSDDGVVNVEIGTDDAGDAVTIDLPVVSAVKEGDQVSIVNNNGDAQAIGVSGWGDALETTVEEQGIEVAAASTAASEARAIAEATNQHFWVDTDGAHVSTTAGDAEGASNSVWNSNGLLIRKQANNLVSLSPSAVSFFDGNGNNASNITAQFGGTSSRIGKAANPHIDIQGNAMFFVDSSNNNNLIIQHNNSRTQFIGYSNFGLEVGTDGSVLDEKAYLSTVKDNTDARATLYAIFNGNDANVAVINSANGSSFHVDADNVYYNNRSPFAVEVKNVTVSNTSAGSNYSSNAIDVSKTGYTPLGVMQTWWASGTSQNKFNDYGTHTEGNNLYIRLWNAGSSAAKGSLNVSILYIANGLI